MTATIKTTSCHCGCGIVFLEIDAVLDDRDNAYFNLAHMAEDAMSEYLERYSFYEEMPDGEM